MIGDVVVVVDDDDDVNDVVVVNKEYLKGVIKLLH